MTPPPLPKIRTYVYKDIRPVAAMTRTLLGLSLLANLASMAATALQWKLFAGGDFTEAEGAANDLVMEVMAYLRLGIYVVTGVSVMVWSYRAHVNARAQGAVGLSDEPEIVAASYIIPFANFWIPFRCMRQLWKHSFPDAGTPGTPPLLILWWMAWLLSVFLGQYVSKFIQVTDLPSGMYATKVQMVWLTCSVASAVLLYLIVTRISADQANRRMLATLPRAEGAIS